MLVFSITVRLSTKYNITNSLKYCISNIGIPHEYLTLSQQEIKRVSKYTYLGNVLNDQWDHSQEIRCSIEKARAVFLKMISVFENRSITSTTKIRCYVFCFEATTSKLATFKMWHYRTILRIPWIDHISNENVCR